MWRQQNRISAQKLFPPSDLRILPYAHKFSSLFLWYKLRRVCIIIAPKFCPGEISFIDVGSIILEHICSSVLPNTAH